MNNFTKSNSSNDFNDFVYKIAKYRFLYDQSTNMSQKDTYKRKINEYNNKIVKSNFNKQELLQLGTKVDNYLKHLGGMPADINELRRQLEAKKQKTLTQVRNTTGASSAAIDEAKKIIKEKALEFKEIMTNASKALNKLTSENTELLQLINNYINEDEPEETTEQASTTTVSKEDLEKLFNDTLGTEIDLNKFKKEIENINKKEEDKEEAKEEDKEEI